MRQGVKCGAGLRFALAGVGALLGLMLATAALVSAQESDAGSSPIAEARLVPGAPHWAK